MTIDIEEPEQSRDFGACASLKITAFDPADLFQLGRHSCHLEELKSQFVIGTTADGTAKYLRIPLVKAQ